MDNKKTLWITRTAVFLALIITWQAATAPLGNTFVTGAVVNLLLIITVMTCGLASGVTAAVLSPVFAKLLGIGPLWSLIPFIAAGNAALAVIWHFIGNIKLKNIYFSYAAALTVAAAAKFLIIYIGIVQIAVPFLLNLSETQANVIAATFSLQQLINPLIGGAAAIVIMPPLKKAVKKTAS